MSDDLVESLRAPLDEDEQMARSAEPGSWEVVGGGPTKGIRIAADDGFVVDLGAYNDGGVADKDDAAHIARHNPSRVLRDVEAKRRIISEMERLREERDALKEERDRLRLGDPEVPLLRAERDVLKAAITEARKQIHLWMDPDAEGPLAPGHAAEIDARVRKAIGEQALAALAVPESNEDAPTDSLPAAIKEI